MKISRVPIRKLFFSQQMRADTQRWGALIDQLGIKAD